MLPLMPMEFARLRKLPMYPPGSEALCLLVSQDGQTSQCCSAQAYTSPASAATATTPLLYKGFHRKLFAKRAPQHLKSKQATSHSSCFQFGYLSTHFFLEHSLRAYWMLGHGVHPACMPCPKAAPPQGCEAGSWSAEDRRGAGRLCYERCGDP